MLGSELDKGYSRWKGELGLGGLKSEGLLSRRWGNRSVERRLRERLLLGGIIVLVLLLGRLIPEVGRRREFKGGAERCASEDSFIEALGLGIDVVGGHRSAGELQG